MRLEVSANRQQPSKGRKREKLTLDQAEIELGLSEIPHAEQVKRDHDNQDRSDVSRSVAGLSNMICVRMKIA